MSDFETENQLCFWPTYKDWLDLHELELDRYLYYCVNVKSRDYVKQQFMENPWLGKVIVEDFIRNTEDVKKNLNELIKSILKPEVFVILVLGMPGSGKTTTVYAIVNILKNIPGIKRICWVSPTEPVLPSFVTWINRPSQLREGDVGVVDEASIRDNARQASSNTQDLMWLAIGRQRGCKIFYLSQLSSIADINIMRWSNIIISKGYDTSAIGIGNAERSMISENPVFDYFKPKIDYGGIKSQIKDWSVVTIGQHNMMLYLPQPAFMTEALSKPFRSYYDVAGGDAQKAEELAMNDATVMRDSGYSASKIATEMITKGYEKKNMVFWRKFTGELKSKGEEDWK